MIPVVTYVLCILPVLIALIKLVHFKRRLHIRESLLAEEKPSVRIEKADRVVEGMCPRVLFVDDVLGTITFNGDYVNKGKFGRVIKITNLPPNSKYTRSVVLKIMKEAKVEMFRDEVSALEDLQSTEGEAYETICHPGRSRIVQFLGSYQDFQNHELCMMFEQLGRDLLDYSNESSLTVADIRIVARDILDALDYCNARGYVHCDVKPENILWVLGGQRRVKLIDFGLACMISDQRTDTVGTIGYLSPEVILGLPRDGKSDVWSLAVTLLSLITMRDVFDVPDGDRGCHLLMMERLCGQRIPQRMIGKSVSLASKRFLVKYRYKPAEIREMFPGRAAHLSRMTIDQVISQCERVDVDFDSLTELLKAMMIIVPSERVSASEALDYDFLNSSPYML